MYNQIFVRFYFVNYDKGTPTSSDISMSPLLPPIVVKASF